MSVNEIFHQVCKDATKVENKFYLSLYIVVPFYGGSEEGGWLGRDISLVSYKEFNSLNKAEDVMEEINKLVDQLNKEEQTNYGNQCLREMDWLEERRLDDSYLKETDGPEEYFVVIETKLGENESKGSRHYE